MRTYNPADPADISIHSLLAEGDLDIDFPRVRVDISIHSLLAEGDGLCRIHPHGRAQFQSTPSSRRETITYAISKLLSKISIHSLLAEGDAPGSAGLHT